MPSRFASGKTSIAECDRCGIRTKLSELRSLTIKTKRVNIRVCRECWEPDQPQLSLGLYPVNDPQAVRDPRPDTSYPESRALVDQIQIGIGVASEIGVLFGVSAALTDYLAQEDDDLIAQEDDELIFI